MLTKNQLKSLLHTTLIYKINVDLLSVTPANKDHNYNKILWFEIDDKTSIFALDNDMDSMDLYVDINDSLCRFIDDNELKSISLTDETFNKLDDITDVYFDVMTNNKLSLNVRLFHKEKLHFIADNSKGLEAISGDDIKSIFKTIKQILK